MATFYCPIEMTGPRHQHMPHEARFFFIEVDAVDAMEAWRMQREQADLLFAGANGQYTRWAPVRDCPSFAYMAALSRGLKASRHLSPEARERIVNDQLALVAA